MSKPKEFWILQAYRGCFQELYLCQDEAMFEAEAMNVFYAAKKPKAKVIHVKEVLPPKKKKVK